MDNILPLKKIIRKFLFVSFFFLNEKLDFFKIIIRQD
jgi:hypothetical protein